MLDERREMHFGGIRVVAALLLLLLTACVPIIQNQKYPSSWPPRDAIAKNECADLTGEYWDLGESGHTKSRSQSLSELLFKQAPGRPEWHWPTINNLHVIRPSQGLQPPARVRIGLDKSAIVAISVWQDTTELGRRPLLVRRAHFLRAADEMKCTADGIQVWGSAKEGGRDDDLYMSRALDGALIVKHRGLEFGGNGGPGGGILVAARNVVWYRFLPSLNQGESGQLSPSTYQRPNTDWARRRVSHDALRVSPDVGRTDAVNLNESD